MDFSKLKLFLLPTLSILLYMLAFYLRYQQPAWEFNLDLFADIRESLDQRINKMLPSPQAELLSGIILGNKKDLPASLKLALRDTSTLHMVVVSGQNLTLLAALLMSLSGLIRRKWAIFISLIGIIFYTLLTGAQIPVLRAAIMAILSFTAQIFGRQKDAVWILMLTAAVLLLVNPRWISDLSFQLSFLATLGVLVVAPVLESKLNFFPNFIKQDITITVGAQVMVIPVIAQYFHQISIVGVLSNLLVGWTIPIIMVLGTLMILLGSLFAFFTNIFLTYFTYVVYFFASLPFAWEYVGEQIWVVWVGYYMVVSGVLLAVKKNNKLQ